MMDVTESLKIVAEQLQEESGLLVKIALMEGIDYEAFKKLQSALKFLIEYYKDKESVPKRLAACFIDITPLIERSIDQYSDIEKFKIEDIRNEIVTLGVELFE